MTIPFKVKLLTKTAKAPEQGDRFGRWVLIKFTEKRTSHNYWLCKCECGTKRNVSIKSLMKGDSSSCGCFREENRTNLRKTHGFTNTRTHNVWCQLRSRCGNEQSPKYKNYGGRGIKVCDRWKNSFENFLEDMGKCPSNKYSIDRIDNEKGYNKQNCRWATNTQQQRNTRKNFLIQFEEKTKPLSEWCEILNLPYARIYRRLKSGYSPEESFSKTIFRKKVNSKMEIVDNINDSERGAYGSSGK